jgi:subtilisin family serine protease
VNQSHREWSQVLQSQSEWSQVLQSQSEWSQVLQSQSEWAQVLQSQSEWSQVLSLAPMYGHGTAVAGLVHLVAPDAMIIPLKAFDAEGFSDEWTIMRAIYDAVEMGADVINMSFGSYQRSKIVEEAINRAAALGVVFVAAAGNDDDDRPTFPAALENVIAVTSVTAMDTKASFANFGRYVDISGPGQHIVSTYPGGYCQVSGTSESAPFVSGVVALAKSVGVHDRKLVSVVESAVDVIPDGFPYKHKLGTGRVNAAKAVRQN